MTEQEKRVLERLTVDLLMEIRAAYLATPGCSALKHWDQLQSRMRVASRTCSTVEEWSTAMHRGLQLPAPRNSTCLALSKLVGAVAEIPRGQSAWLDMVEREYAYLLSRCRLESERRKEQKAQQRGGNFIPDDDAPEALPDETVEAMYGGDAA